MRWHTGAGTAALVMALALGGCAKDPTDGNGVASADGGRSAGPSPSASADPRELMLKFAQCMREHGIDMEDPKEGEGVHIGIRSGQEETLKKAQEACRAYTPGANGFRPDPQMAEKGRRFAQCMRDHGVEDFPDPDPDEGGLRIDTRQGEDPDFRKAQEACQDILGGKGLSLPPGDGKGLVTAP